jgi:hypothetical protein
MNSAVPDTWPRDAEIHHQGPPASRFEKDVVRLDVTVNDSLSVRVAQRPGDLAEDTGDFRRWPRAAGPDTLSKRLAVDVGHREQYKLADLIYREDRHDVWVRQPGRGARLVEEPLARCRLLRQFGRQDLDGHRPVEADLAGQVDDPHTAATQLAFQRITTGQRFLELVKVGARLVGHGGACMRGPPYARRSGRQPSCGLGTHRGLVWRGLRATQPHTILE